MAPGDARFPGQMAMCLRDPASGKVGHLEPVRLAGEISPIPFIQISATEDERIPEESAQALFDALKEPHKLVWIPSIHVMPYMDDLIEQMMAIAREELIELGLLY